MRGTTNIPCVYVLLRHENKTAFVLREHTGYMDGKYSLPAGHVEEGESFRVAAAREALEEVNARVSMDDLRHVHTMHRNCGDHIRVDVFFEADNWTGELRNNEPMVHSAFEWLPGDSLPENTVMDYQLHAIQAIMRGETYSEFGWAA